MKAVLISIKPRYVKDILKGIKTLEIRKSIPKCDLPIDVYIYCTKNQGKKNYLSIVKTDLSNGDKYEWKLNGKVVAKFTLKKVEDFYNLDNIGLAMACLSKEEINTYLKGKIGYAWHIADLEIFNKPKELSEFFKPTCNGCPFENTQTCHNDIDGKLCRITKAPQSWCYVSI